LQQRAELGADFALDGFALAKFDARSLRSRLDDLAVFVEVAEAGSLTEAARRLGVPKSTVSRAVARLETALGIALLRRSSRGHGLSDSGRRLARAAAMHVASLHDAGLAIERPAREPHGRLRITAPVDLGQALLGPLLPQFTARHPSVHIEVELTSRFVDLIAEGFDLALRVPANKLPPSALVARRLGGVELNLYAAPSYLARHGSPRQPEDLREKDTVLLHPRDGCSRWTLAGSRGTIAVDVRGQLGSNDFTLIRELIASGAGVGMLPSILAVADLRSGRLVRVLPEYTLRGSVVYLVYPASRPMPVKIAVFRDFLLEHAPPLLKTPVERHFTG
jgi:DNA-binding transcriptional LysR family regulator